MKCDSFQFQFTVVGGRVEGGAEEWTLEGGWDAAAQIPTEYVLMSAYPNPFNAQTSIQFGLPEAGNVNLTIYNLMGQKVAILVDGHKDAGHHTVAWDGANYSSGIYFYRLTVPTESGSSTGDQVFTKRMTLLK